MFMDFFWLGMMLWVFWSSWIHSGYRRAIDLFGYLQSPAIKYLILQRNECIVSWRQVTSSQKNMLRILVVKRESWRAIMPVKKQVTESWSTWLYLASSDFRSIFISIQFAYKWTWISWWCNDNNKCGCWRCYWRSPRRGTKMESLTCEWLSEFQFQCRFSVTVDLVMEVGSASVIFVLYFWHLWFGRHTLWLTNTFPLLSRWRT